jgi:hypothetical protein
VLFLFLDCYLFLLVLILIVLILDSLDLLSIVGLLLLMALGFVFLERVVCRIGYICSGSLVIDLRMGLEFCMLVSLSQFSILLLSLLLTFLFPSALFLVV